MYAEGHPSAFGLGIDVIDDKGECAGEGIYQFIDYTNEALKVNGFSSKIPLADGTIMELRLEGAVYAGKNVDLNVKKKFVY